MFENCSADQLTPVDEKLKAEEQYRGKKNSGT